MLDSHVLLGEEGSSHVVSGPHVILGDIWVLTWCWAIFQVVDGVKLLVDMEKRLEAGKAIDDLIPKEKKK